MKVIKAILIALSIFLIIYLTFCFMSADFNITHWDAPARAFCGFLGFILGISVAAAYLQLTDRD